MPITSPENSKTASPSQCPACGVSSEPEFLYRKWGYRIRKCKSCGLGSTDLNGFDPAGIYSSAYFKGGQKDGYADYIGSEGVLRLEFKNVINSLHASGRREGSLLEIGCAYGFFLAEAQKSFRASGIEICAEAAAYCRGQGLDVTPGAVTESILGDKGPFDVTVMLDVIEHLPDPLSILTLIHRHMNAGGHLLISTGDWGSLPSKIMGRSWRLMTPPQHLFFFSTTTIRSILERAGFRVIAVSRPWKQVPLNLILFQFARMLGLRPKATSWLGRLGLPVNLFDAMRVIAVKDQP